jgi:hypothetical protein
MWALVADPGNNTAALFIDGARISAQPMTDDWPAAPGTFQAAIGATTKQPFKGAQGLVAVYEMALSNAQITMLYQASRGGQNVYEYVISNPQTGSWLGRCTMTVRTDGQTTQGDSGDIAFDIPGDQSFVLVFQAPESPQTPQFPLPGTLTPG